MTFDLIPWDWKKKNALGKPEGEAFNSLQNEINRLFGDFWRGGNLAAFQGKGFVPDIDLVDNGESFEIHAELPGLEEKDVDLSIVDNVLTIKGEKKFNSEEKKKGYYHMERSYGSFQRSFTLPVEVDSAKVDASFKNGVLQVILPKTPESKAEVRKINIKKG